MKKLLVVLVVGFTTYNLQAESADVDETYTPVAYPSVESANEIYPEEFPYAKKNEASVSMRVTKGVEEARVYTNFESNMLGTFKSVMASSRERAQGTFGLKELLKAVNWGLFGKPKFLSSSQQHVPLFNVNFVENQGFLVVAFSTVKGTGVRGHVYISHDILGSLTTSTGKLLVIIGTDSVLVNGKSFNMEYSNREYISGFKKP